jgi:hypothetical protein
MRKLYLSVIGLYVTILSAFCQTSTDTSGYTNRKLRLEEINFVSSYYHQNGDHSPVTGGIGTEKLSDIASSLEIKMKWYRRPQLKQECSLEMEIEHYTSASSDNINPYTISSASSHDTKLNPSASYIITNEQKGWAAEIDGSYAVESIYRSKGSGFAFTKTSADKNRELSAKLYVYLDKISLVLPIEFRPGRYVGARHDPRSERNSYGSSFTFKQVIDSRLQCSVMLDLAYQHGYLSTPFYRNYFTDGYEAIEKLPSSRFKFPVGVRLNYFLGDRWIIRSFYRFYKDSWGLTANTYNIEIPVKVTPFVSISPFYRFYSQNSVRYYGPYRTHTMTEEYFTTDDDLSKFESNYLGGELRLAPLGGVFKIQHLATLELRGGYYKRTDGLHAYIMTLAVGIK